VTLLTQLSLGVLASTVVVGGGGGGGEGGAVAAGAGALALAVATLHLGRPAAAWKALRNLRRSWLSREVALFAAFSAATFAYVGWRSAWLGGLAILLGTAGVYASGRLYLVPARPVWNSPRTLVAFYATALSTGPLAAVALAPSEGAGPLLGVAAAGCLLQLLVIQRLAAAAVLRPEREYQLTARLLFGHFRPLLVVRIALAVAAVMVCGLAVVLGAPRAGWGAVAFVLAVGGEAIGRYLFFVTVTPMTAARRFSSGTR
jgi:DMSO reductase anchor subunit